MSTVRVALRSATASILLAGLVACGGGPAASAPKGTAAAPVAAPEGQRYQLGAASSDGIGKRYMGREIARVMGFEGAAWLEREERLEEERTDLLLDLLVELGARPGTVVADIGAGSGYFTLPLARRVGPAGKVYAVDVQPEMLALVRDKSERLGLGNVVLVEAAEDDPRLPEGDVDLALLVDVYHELAYPYEVMRSLVDALAPSGRVVLVEYRGEDPELPIRPLHKMTEEQVKREMAALPLAWVTTRDDLPWQHVLVFERRSELGTKAAADGGAEG